MRKGVRHIWTLMAFLVTVVVMSGCGGGGGSSSQTATVNGSVTFPASATSGTPKALAAAVAATDLTVEAYNLAGKKVGTVSDLQRDNVTNIYSYKISGLAPGTDYIIKAVRGNQVLKKLVEKKLVVAGAVPVQANVDLTTTTAVIVAQKMLNAENLGEAPLPEGVTASAISNSIATAVQPALLESKIEGLKTNAATNLSLITSSGDASLVNLYNLVQVAVSNGVDSEKLLANEATLPTTVTTIQQVTLSGTTPTVTNVPPSTAITSATNVTYTPPTIGEVAAPYVASAKDFLNKQDIASANTKFEEALAIDPDNKDANFGGAITKTAMLLVNSDVKNIITKWEGSADTVNAVVTATSPIGNPFRNLTSAMRTPVNPLAKTAANISANSSASTTKLALNALSELKAKLPHQQVTRSSAKMTALVPATAPTVTEMQTVITNVIIPALTNVSARLAKVEGKGYTFVITKAMQGNPLGVDITLSDGDFYSLDAAVNGIVAMLKIATAYNFDVAGNNYNTIAQDPLATFNSTSFFTLKTDGRAAMADALTAVKTARDKAEAAYGALKTRTAGVGAIDIAGWTYQDRADFEKFLADAKVVLAGKTAITIGDQAVNIDVTKFFTNPLTRANLPELGYDVPRNPSLSAKYGEPVAAEQTVQEYYWDGVAYVYGDHQVPTFCDIRPKSDIPDYTLNGILPDNSAAGNIGGFNGVLPLLEGKVLTGATDNVYRYFYSPTTDGTYIYYLTYGNTATSVMKIDPTAGTIARVAEAQGFYNMFHYNGGFYSLEVTGSSINLYPIITTGSSWTRGTTSAAQLSYNGPSYGYMGGVVTSGPDIYFNFNAYTHSTVYKISSLGTPQALFTVDGEIYNIIFNNGSLYVTTNNWMEKRNPATGALIASFIADADVAVGGYFYELEQGKLLRSAGTPAGSAAKVAARF